MTLFGYKNGSSACLESIVQASVRLDYDHRSNADIVAVIDLQWSPAAVDHMPDYFMLKRDNNFWPLQPQNETVLSRVGYEYLFFNRFRLIAGESKLAMIMSTPYSRIVTVGN